VTIYRFEVEITGAPRATADDTRDETAGAIEDFIESHRPAGAISVGELVEIETMQLIGIKEGREVDLGDMPLSPEMKMREIARQYGNPDDEDDYPAGVAIGAMQDLITWMKQQGKLK